LSQTTTISLLLVLLSAPWLTQAQEPLGKKAPSVTMSPPAVSAIPRGKAGAVELQFRVSPGFHINSNQPTAEYLIPTTLKMDPPTDIVVGKITYPKGKEMSFAFAPDEKLSVYSGSFMLAVSVRPLASVLPGKYELRGELKYQACDNAQCFPPKKLPVQFEVKVVKAPAPARKNPGQSPHVHS
jgi:DsbC/DsbD-like thiol-disulfide interchange protein